MTTTYTVPMTAAATAAGLDFVESLDGSVRYHRLTCRRCMTLDSLDGLVTHGIAADAKPATCCKPTAAMLATYIEGIDK